MAVHVDGTPVYRYRIDEVIYLERAARIADRLAAIEAELDEMLGVIEPDGTQSGALSMRDVQGRPHAHPLLAEQARFTGQLLSLLKMVPLPNLEAADEGHNAARTLAEHQRAAGRARWKKPASKAR